MDFFPANAKNAFVRVITLSADVRAVCIYFPEQSLDLFILLCRNQMRKKKSSNALNKLFTKWNDFKEAQLVNNSKANEHSEDVNMLEKVKTNKANRFTLICTFYKIEIFFVSSKSLLKRFCAAFLTDLRIFSKAIVLNLNSIKVTRNRQFS